MFSLVQIHGPLNFFSLQRQASRTIVKFLMFKIIRVLNTEFVDMFVNLRHKMSPNQFQLHNYQHYNYSALSHYADKTVCTKLCTILVHNQLNEQFFMYVYFYSLHVSGSHVSIIRRIIVSMRHLVYVTLCR